MNIIDVATAHSVDTRIWKNKKIPWLQFAKKIKTEHKTLETLKEYQASPKTEKSKIKDVGGYFGGYLRGGKRSPQNVVYRQLLTLDIDFGHLSFWEDFILQFTEEAIIHSTHSHTEEKPRYRLIMPLDRDASPDEYSALARKVAGLLGIEYFDNTTFETNRLMFWPSVSKDASYYCEHQAGDFLNVDNILNLYQDWRDTSLWPTNAQFNENINSLSKKQEKPTDKKGLVGAFCKAYDIASAIETYLPDTYISTNEESRFTYSLGTTAKGLIVYEDCFAYSHHSTDPISGKLCNSFDLVRLHKFGDLDDDNKSGSGSKSYKAMEALVQKDKKVKKIIAVELLKAAKIDFGDSSSIINIEKESDWMAELETDSKGNYLSTSSNINTILENDKQLNNRLAHNVFDAKNYLLKSVPWRKIRKMEPIKNVDFSGFRNYIECLYGIASMIKIDDSMNLQFEKHSFNPVKEYLEECAWDGEKRVDSLLIDYLGCKDDLYSREAARKTLVGAVARVFDPGCKFDLVLTIVGEQGEGKSTLVNKLGGPWFSDTFLSVQGKEALEQIQGAWIIEIAELSGFRKSDMEAVKHFISKQTDTFRPAYARTSETFERMCIFIGTTNKHDFLRDATGNRRFLPVTTSIGRATKSIFNDLSKMDIAQIWGEAVELYRKGEKLYMSAEASALAKNIQSSHSEVDEREGLIHRYLDTLLPKDWSSMDLSSRRMFLNDPLSKKGVIERDFVCIAEVWSECLNKEKEDMTRYNTRDLNDMLRSLSDWDFSGSTKSFPLYGKQKYYAKKL